jgi:hypothetical protein
MASTYPQRNTQKFHTRSSTAMAAAHLVYTRSSHLGSARTAYGISVYVQICCINCMYSCMP